MIGIAAAVMAGLVWWRVSAGRLPDVPTCVDLVAALPSVTAATWSVSKPDVDRRLSRSSAMCEMAFADKDGRLSGTASLLIAGTADADEARSEARSAPCYGDVVAPGDARGYLALRSCTETIGDTVRATVVAARERRWMDTVVSVHREPEAAEEGARRSQDLALAVAQQALTLQVK